MRFIILPPHLLPDGHEADRIVENSDSWCLAARSAALSGQLDPSGQVITHLEDCQACCVWLYQRLTQPEEEGWEDELSVMHYFAPVSKATDLCQATRVGIALGGLGSNALLDRHFVECNDCQEWFDYHSSEIAARQWFLTKGSQ